MPFKDGHSYIQSALESVECQLVNDVDFDVEVIIVDDHSSNKLTLATDCFSFVVKIVRNDDPCNYGAGYARGLAINHAQGRYIAFLDCDDQWMPNKLSAQINEMNKRNWAFSFGGYQCISSHGAPLGPCYIPNGPFNKFRFLSKAFTVGCLTVMYDRNKLNDPDPSPLMRRNDYHLWIQLINQADGKGVSWGATEECIGMYRVQSNSLSSPKLKSIMAHWLFLNVAEDKILRRMIYFLGYLFRTIKRRLLHG